MLLIVFWGILCKDVANQNLFSDLQILLSSQPILPGKTCPITYDFAHIEVGLRSLLLLGKQSLRLQIHHYLYRGEMRGSGRLVLVFIYFVCFLFCYCLGGVEVIVVQFLLTPSQINNNNNNNKHRVSGLRRKIPQEDLPNVVLNTICDEFDTQDRVLKFLSRLETCISFLADTGGEGVRGLAISRMSLRFVFWVFLWWWFCCLYDDYLVLDS